MGSVETDADVVACVSAISVTAYGRPSVALGGVERMTAQQLADAFVQSKKGMTLLRAQKLKLACVRLKVSLEDVLALLAEEDRRLVEQA